MNEKLILHNSKLPNKSRLLSILVDPCHTTLHSATGVTLEQWPQNLLVVGAWVKGQTGNR